MANKLFVQAIASECARQTCDVENSAPNSSLAMSSGLQNAQFSITPPHTHDHMIVEAGTGWWCGPPSPQQVRGGSAKRGRASSVWLALPFAFAAALLLVGLVAQQQQQQRQQPRQHRAHSSSSSSSGELLLGVALPRPHVFIGVFTGFSKVNASQRYHYTTRRAALRATWFGGPEQRQWLQEEHGVVMRFVVGSSANPAQEAALQAEARQHGDILRLPLQENYKALSNKTRTFFRMAADLQPDWIVKVDDDVFLNPDRLAAASRQWSSLGVGYVGCMRRGGPMRRPSSRWHEPAHVLVGNAYWLHGGGSIYAVSGPVARAVIADNFANLRLLANEDTSLGLWMLASNVTHFDDARLCSDACRPSSVAVFSCTTCPGLKNPVRDLKKLHGNASCSGPARGPLPFRPSHDSMFDRMWQSDPAAAAAADVGP